MLAVPVIDVVLIGTVHRSLDSFASGGGAPVTVSLLRDGRLVRIDRGDDDPGSVVTPPA
jgi:hypothetical protein